MRKANANLDRNVRRHNERMLEGAMKNGGKFAEQRSIELSTYILCGFSNFASIGIQIGGIGALAPTRKGLLSKLGFRALVGGTVACLLTAAIVGMML